MSFAWNLENAAHLLRRTGFGPRLAEVQAAYEEGFEATLGKLFKPDSANQVYPGTLAKPATGPELQAWWLKRILKTKSPLIEKLTLFWHNHFATGIAKVIDPRLMFQQNVTLRKRCAGKFYDLVLAVAKDPAMMVWLDTTSNVVGSPNLNFARELMELFTTGVYNAAGNPNYSENDVKEAARCFTGWTVVNNQFAFDLNKHDFGVKTFRGVTGNLNGELVVQILCADFVTARHIAWKLYQYFARPIALSDPLLQPMVAAYQQSGGSIRAMLEALFSSDEFYSPAVKYAHVKGPVEFFVGALRMLKGKYSKKKSHAAAQGWQIHLLGQPLFDPPTVFGWNEGKAWVTSNTFMARARAGNVIATVRDFDKPPFSWKLEKLLGPKTDWPLLDAQTIVMRTLATLQVGNVLPTTFQALVDYMHTDAHGQFTPFHLDDTSADEKVRGLVALILASPEFQLS